MTVPLLVNNRDRGEVQIVFAGKQDETRVKVNDLLKQIKDILKPDVMNALSQDVIGQEHIKLGRLNAHQITARYDSKKLELHLDIPAELRKTEVISFRPSYSNLTSDDLIRPSDLSAYINVFFDLQYVWKGDIAGRQPANIVFDGALNYSDWVLEGEAFYREGNVKPFQRGNVSVVKDLLEHIVR
ncbi:MAG: hypothetical protein IIC11_10045, partial [Proteobacteria bacterium]|nr:hypothetical protein [Pseudomonadota bacterium]